MDKAPENQVPRTPERQAEDIAYTINHAFACTATDLAGGPYVGHTILRHVFHKHSHAADWFISEGIGDFIAVPITVAVQNRAPRVVDGVRKVMEGTLGWAFRKSAHREARAWARDNAVTPDSEQAKDKEQQIYHYEIEHLPQAAVWTATSFAFNIAALKLFDKHLHHEDHDHGAESLLALAGGLLGSKTFSTGLVVGTRAAFPDKAQKWDGFAARHVYLPATKGVSKLFGISPESVERMEKQREESEGGSWEQRVSERAGSGSGTAKAGGK